MSERDDKEMKSLFADPKFARKAWKSIGMAILNNPCQSPIGQYDKDGNSTMASDIEAYTYRKLKEDIKCLGKGPGREPTEIEMILACQAVRARYDTGAAVFIRDTVGGKPIDETKLDAQINNPYEELTDDELEALSKLREAKRQAEIQAASQPEANATEPLVVLEAENANT